MTDALSVTYTTTLTIEKISRLTPQLAAMRLADLRSYVDSGGRCDAVLVLALIERTKAKARKTKGV